MFVGKPSSKRSQPTGVHLTWTKACDASATTADNSMDLESAHTEESLICCIRPKHTRTVRFAPLSRQRTYRSRRDMPQRLKDTMWYNQEDFDRMRLEMHKTAYTATSTDICYAAACDKVCRTIYQITSSMNMHQVEIMVHDVDFLTKLSESLHMSDTNPESFRGLEDIISSDRQFLRFDVSEEIRSIIVDLSAQQLNDDPAAQQEELAQHYHEMSLTGTVLARIAAIADASAVQEDVHE